MKKSMIYSIICLVIIYFTLRVITIFRKPTPDKPFFSSLPQEQILVVAHRGGSLIFPENTMAAFSGALSLGAHMLEMDVHLTADGIPVVIHDDTVDRTTDGVGNVNGFTLEELKRLDAGYRFSLEDQPDTHPFRNSGVTIPTLREVFEAFPQTPIILEVKENSFDLTDAVIDLIDEFNRQDLVLMASFHAEILDYIRQKRPQTATHASEDEVKAFLPAAWLFLEGLIAPAYEAFIIPKTSGRFPVASTRFIEAANRRNIFVGVWTINDAHSMRQLIDKGVDALITDRPDLALEMLEKHILSE